jgi:hypothetical protein
MSSFKNVFGALLLFIFSSNISAATFSIVTDTATKICKVEGLDEDTCTNDEECSISKKVCELSMDSLAGVLEGEAIQQVIRYLGPILLKTSNTIVKFGVEKSSKTVSNRLLRLLTDALRLSGNALKHNSHSRVTQVKGFSPVAVLEFFIDLSFSIAVSEYVDNLDQKDLNLVRNAPLLSSIPGFNKGSNDAIKKSLKRILQVLYNDMKGVVFINGHPIIAARAAIVGNGLILAEISVDVVSTASEVKDLQLSNALQDKHREIMELYAEYMSNYFHAKGKEQYNISVEADQKCSDIQFNTIGSSISALLSTKYSLLDLNSKLMFFCGKYKKQMHEAQKSKHTIIANATLHSFERYKQFVEYFFPLNERPALYRYYIVENFDLDYRISNNHVAHKYIKRAVAHGLRTDQILENQATFEQGSNVDEREAYHLILWALWAGDLDDTNHPYNYSPDSDYQITRAEYASLIISAFQLEDKLSLKRKNKLKLNAGIYEQSGKDWPYDGLVLKEFKIVNSAVSSFRSNELLTKYEKLVMLVNALDYSKCGYVGCKISYLVGVEK